MSEEKSPHPTMPLFRAGIAMGEMMRHFSMEDADKLEPYLQSEECNIDLNYIEHVRALIVLRRLMPKEAGS